VLEKCEYLGIDPDDSDYYILYDAIRSYGSMRLGISGFVVSASYMMVAVKGMREEQGEKGRKRIPTLFAYVSLNNGPVFLSRCILP
jgi:hypothetical protein